MKHLSKSASYAKQRGIALFFALIALLAISLAAVALIRSVDTSTLIAGNLAFKQSATTSGDAGVEAAMSWMSTIETANAGLSVLTQIAHPFNNTGGIAGALNPGYYSSLDATLSLTDGTGIQWNANDSCGTGPNCADAVDPSGNTTRYIIQRMCRNANQLVPAANCLFSGAALDNGGHATPLPQNVCIGEGCPSSGQAPQNRITSRTTGPRNTVSYIQAFVY